MPQRPCAGVLPAGSSAATALCVAVGVAANFFDSCFAAGSRVATTGRAAGFDLAGASSFDVKGSSHLPPPPRRAGALAGLLGSTGGAAWRVPVDLRLPPVSKGSSQSPEARFDEAGGAAAVFLRAAGRTSSSSTTCLAATCLPPPLLRGDGSENGSAHSPGFEFTAAVCLRTPAPGGGAGVRVVVVVATAGRALPEGVDPAAP